MPQLQETGPSPVPLPLQRCIAVYDNVAECADELAFRCGDVLTLIEQDTSGMQGWWLCSIRGRQGICPGNRLKLLDESDHVQQRDTKRQTNKVVTGVDCQKYNEVYLYDMPPPSRPALGSQQQQQFQYDVPPSSHLVCPSSLASSESGGEVYDVPRALQQGAGGLSHTRQLTPSSSLSSLTSDSNRSSLIQEYDIPRPPRHIILQQQPQVYDVPKELPLEMNSALEYLGRLESETTGATCRLLAYAGPHWRLQSRLEPRLMEIKLAILRLRTSLHDLANFTESALANAANAHDKGLSVKMRPLVTAIREADRLVDENSRRLEALCWDSAALSLPPPSSSPSPGDDSPHQPMEDPLDNIVTCATQLTDDVRQIASFIQGNSTLLFKRRSGVVGGGSSTVWDQLVDYDYVNLNLDNINNTSETTQETADKREQQQQLQQLTHDTSTSPTPSPIPAQPPLDPADKQVMCFYLGQCSMYVMHLTNAIQAFLQTVELNHPPKVFLAHIKFVVLSAHRLVNIGDTVHRNVRSESVRRRVLECSNCLCEALAQTVHKTKLAALHFPSVSSVQEMIDSVMDISHITAQLKHTISSSQDQHSERHL